MIDVPTKGKKYVLEHHFNGLPTLENFKLVDVDIPELQTGGILLKYLHGKTYKIIQNKFYFGFL